MSAVWQTTFKFASEKLVLLALADNANDEGFCWPSISTLAAKCDLHRTTVIGHIKSLEEKGFVHTLPNANGQLNKYRLTINQSDQTTGSAIRPVAPADRNRSRQTTGPVASDYPNHKEPSKEPSIKPKPGFSVPDCFEKVDGFMVALTGWIEARKAKRNPPTGHAIQLALNRLTERPGDAIACLNEAAMSGWAGINWNWFDKAQATQFKPAARPFTDPTTDIRNAKRFQPSP